MKNYNILTTIILLFVSIVSQSQDTTTFRVYGVCDMCQQRIEQASLGVKGVQSATWDIDKGLLTLINSPTIDIIAVHEALAQVGHDTDLMKASDENYANLHACCKYRPEPEDELLKTDSNLDHNKIEESHSLESPANMDVEMEVEGMVYAEDVNGQREALVGVNVFWVGQNSGTSTDEDGHFVILANFSKELIFSYVGFRPDTIDMTGESMVAIVMQEAFTLETIEVSHKQKSTRVSFLDPIKSHKIGERELLKAACCNLSESFETTPSIDVSSTDAITGTRKIELLGLNGANIQIARENMPYIRGLSATYGLEYIPGTWIEGIQLNMGAGSVVNGFESITGQINVELKKPTSGDLFFLNLYASQGGRYEANINARTQVSDKWHTGILFHQRVQNTSADNNADGFRDDPNGEQTFIINRWKYEGNRGWMAQFGLGGLYINKESGQLDFDSELLNSGFWGNEIITKRIEGWAKMGRVIPDKPYASYGLQLSASYHDQESFFGNRNYNSDQKSMYANFIYQSIIGNTQHTFKTGGSFQYDNIEEEVDNSIYTRNEVVPGLFFEYSYTPTPKFSFVAGIRGDVHNDYGFFMTPRLHLRYAPVESSVFRVALGRGQRTPSIFSENIGLFASSREIRIASTDTSKPYGLEPNVAWSFGLNFVQELSIQSRSLIFEIDLHRTHFSEQILTDYDLSAQEVNFYNLAGSSFSNSFQASINYEVLPHFDVRIAYRYNDVQSDMKGGRLKHALSAPHRAFVNLAYQTTNDWMFDFTLNRVGSKRIPNTGSNPESFRLLSDSPAFFVSNAQISKSWSKKFDVYLGTENVLDYKQDEAILSAEDPFGPYFDASLIWGPVFGRKVYAGIRYRI